MAMVEIRQCQPKYVTSGQYKDFTRMSLFYFKYWLNNNWREDIKKDTSLRKSVSAQDSFAASLRLDHNSQGMIAAQR